MPLNVMFIYGFIGAFAVDFQIFFEEVNRLKTHTVGIPRRFTNPSYWMILLIHAAVGGCLATAWGETYPSCGPLMLVAVGGSTRVLVDKFSRLLAQKLGN
jgi:hypothetical protein